MIDASVFLLNVAAWFIDLTMAAITFSLVRSVLRRRKRRKAAGG